MPRRLGSIIRSQRKLLDGSLSRKLSKKSVSWMNDDEKDGGGDDVRRVSAISTSRRSGDSYEAGSDHVSSTARSGDSIGSEFSAKVRRSNQALEFSLDNVDADGRKRSSVNESVKPSTSEKLSKAVIEASKSPRRITVRERLSSSTLAQLRLADLKLHGREDDMALLKDKLSNITNVGQEIILVAGVSGIGKSALVSRGLERPAKKRGIAFVRGKFDLNNNALPYSAFADALSMLAKHVSCQSNVDKVKSDIQEALGDDDMAVISNAMQGCDDFFAVGLHNYHSKSTRFNKTGGKEAVNRLQYAVRRLMKVVCSNLKNGVVMFIDDLQWSDSSSLDLLQSLLQDKDIPSLLLVGAYRNDEVPESHPLALHVKEAERLGSTITKIELGNLEQESVRNLVAEALGMEDRLEKVETLAGIVHTSLYLPDKKTKGNPFFVIFFLRSLYDDELLEYNFAIASWRWYDEKINEKLMTENVASMMVNKLRRLKITAQHVIKVASCLGASFSTKMLETVFEKSPYELFIDDENFVDSSTIASTIDEIISTFEDEGLWEREEDSELDTYRFAHDQIQSAAFELVPPEKRDDVKGSIGGVLLKGLDPETFDKCLFEIVSLRNCAVSSLSEEERIDLAYLNVQAGIKASKNAAFDTSVVYFESARNLFGPKAWDDGDSDSLVDLYIKEAQARFVIGHLEIMEKLVEELLSKDLPIKQVFEAYEVKILAAQAANRFDEAISVALEVRRKLGCKPIPTKPSMLTVIREFRKTTKAVGGRSAEELAALPTLTDERVAIGQRMLELLCTSTYQGNPQMFPLISFRAVRDTIKHGVNRSSCDGLVTFGVLLSGVFGDPKKGREMGRAGELICGKPDLKRMRSRVAFHVHGINYHNTSPLQGTLRPMLEGYQVGLQTGDTESACWNLCFRSCYLFFAASPLDDISSELDTGVKVLNQMNQVGTMMCVMPYFQAVKNLCGKEEKLDLERPWVLSGADYNFDDAMDFAENTAKNKMLAAFIMVGQLDLLVIYQKWNLAEELLLKGGDLRPCMPGFFQAVQFTFLEGLICLKAAQASGSWREKRKWVARAKKSMKMLKVGLAKGNVNSLHTLHLLTAEFHVSNGKIKEAEESFKKAQISAKRTGFVQDRALAHELAGLHYMKMGDDYWAKHNIKLAHEAYVDWQAKVKAEHLHGKYPKYLSDDEK